jgi:DNA-binding transcriptional MerR regulator
MRVFTTSEITKLYGFTQRQIDGWDKTGLISPSIRPAKGKGSHRLYALSDVICFRFVKRLQEAGWHTRTIRTALRNLRYILPERDPLRDLVLLNINGSIVARCSMADGQVVLLDALSQGQLVMMFTLSSLQDQAIADVRMLDAGHETHQSGVY